MFTLAELVPITTLPARKDLPINTAPRYANSDPLAAKPVLGKYLEIPRFQPSTPQHNPALELQCFVQCANLLHCLLPCRREPVHAVHDHDDGQRGRTHARDNLADFVGVDAQTVECVGLAELDVALGGEIGGVRCRRVVAQEGEEVVVVLGAEQRGVDDGLEGVEDVFVDSVAGAALQRLV